MSTTDADATGVSLALTDDKKIRITEEYYEELLADRIRINALERIHILARTSTWGPTVGKFSVHEKGWFSKSFYGNDIRSTIDKWIALTVDDQEES